MRMTVAAYDGDFSIFQFFLLSSFALPVAMAKRTDE
jgi:hypothetical protein